MLRVKPWAHIDQMIQICDTEDKDEAKPLSTALAYGIEGWNGRPDRLVTSRSNEDEGRRVAIGGFPNLASEAHPTPHIGPIDRPVIR